MIKQNPLKRLCAFAVLTALFFTVEVFALEMKPSALETGGNQSSGLIEITDTEFEVPVRLLRILSILDGNEWQKFNPDKDVTRAEFVSMVSRMLRVGNVQTGAITYFSDVPDGYWAKENISLAYRLGIVSGAGGDSFLPDELITFEQAVKILVYTLGYDVFAQNLGGYPTGYFAIALERGITGNINMKFGDTVKAGDMVKLIDNTLHAEYLSQLSYGANPKYETSNDKTMLSELYNVTKIRGIVTADGYTGLTSESKIQKDQILIDGVKYNIGSEQVDSLLGYEVVAYVQSDKNLDNNLIILYYPDKSHNDFFRIYAEDLLLENPAYTVTNFVYLNESGRSRNIKVSERADVIYNGIAYADFNLETLKPKSGYIDLIDNNNDGYYDVIKIMETKNYVVAGVGINDYIIYDKYDQENILLDPLESIDYRITKKGHAIELGELEEWDVLSVAQSIEKKFVLIEVSSDSVRGTVDEVSDDKLMISGAEYEIADNYTEYIFIGMKGTFYLDLEGKIAAYDPGQISAVTYGYLIQAEVEESLDSRLAVKVFNLSENVSVFTSTKKIILDGNATGDYKFVLTCLAESAAIIDPSATGVSQLIRYRLDSDGNLCEIDTINKTEYEDDNTLELTLSKSELSYKMEPKTFGGKFILSDQAVVISVPSDPLDEELYSVKTASTTFKNDDSYLVAAFDASDTRLTNIITFYEKESSDPNMVDPLQSMVLVDKVTKVLNNDGEMVQKLYGLESSKMIGELAKNASLLDGLKRGDIIRYNKSSKYGLTFIEKILDIRNTTIESGEANQGNYNAGYRAVFGEVYAKDRSTLLLTYGSGDDVQVVNLRSRPIYVYDFKDDRVWVGSMADIMTRMVHKDKASKAFVRLKYEDPMEIIIYNNYDLKD